MKGMAEDKTAVKARKKDCYSSLVYNSNTSYGRTAAGVPG